MVRSRLPKPIGGNLGVVAKALLALAKRLFCPSAMPVRSSSSMARPVVDFGEGHRPKRFGAKLSRSPQRIH